MDKRFKLDRARQRALDTFAHGRDLTPHRLADREMRPFARFSGSARRAATSAMLCAASRMSCARRTMTANPQNRRRGR